MTMLLRTHEEILQPSIHLSTNMKLNGAYFPPSVAGSTSAQIHNDLSEIDKPVMTLWELRETVDTESEGRQTKSRGIPH